MTPEALAGALEATWPPARRWQVGPFCLRDGAGGGKRVSAATVEGPWHEADLTAAEAAMAERLFMIRAEDTALDAALAGRGYRVIDPVVCHAVATDALAVPAPFTTFPHWPPLQIARDIWDAGHIGPARIAVMERVQGPKVAILSRAADRPSGIAFVAVRGRIAMLHALEVSPQHRRQGSACNILLAAAHWAREQGADGLALAVTAANVPANALYAALGMTVVSRYHYRQK